MASLGEEGMKDQNFEREEEDSERLELLEEVELLRSEVSKEKERSERLREELGKQALEKRRLSSELAEVRTATQVDVLDDNAKLRQELRKWKNIARHINLELIEHDKEVLKIMQQTAGTRLAWERDVALNRQGIFASKLNAQQKSIDQAVDEAKKLLLIEFEGDLDSEKNARKEAERKVEELKLRSERFESLFNDANKVSASLASSQEELLEELEKERIASKSMTPRKVQEHAENMRRRNRELHLELEELRATHYDKELQIRELKREVEEVKREHEETREEDLRAAAELLKLQRVSTSMQTEDVSIVSNDKMEKERLKMKKEQEKKESLIEAYKFKVEKQNSQLEKQRSHLEKSRTKMEKKLRKASKFIVLQREKQLLTKVLVGWRAEWERETSIEPYRKEIEKRKKQWKAKALCTYFSVYHHRRFNVHLMKVCFQWWKMSRTNVYHRWLLLLHKAFRKVKNIEISALRAGGHLTQRLTVAKSQAIRKRTLLPMDGPLALSRVPTCSAATTRGLAFGVWKMKTVVKKLAKDLRGLRFAIEFLQRQSKEKDMKCLLSSWRRITARRISLLRPRIEAEASVDAKEDGTELEIPEASEVTFVDKTLGMKVGSDVVIKYKKDSNAMQSILCKVQDILQNELNDLQDTVSKEVNRIVHSGSKCTVASKHKLQTRLLQVDMTCSKLLEGLLLIDQTLAGGHPGQVLQSSDADFVPDDVRLVLKDLREIKRQAQLALASLEGLDRKVAVGKVIKADIPNRISFLYKSRAPAQDYSSSLARKSPEWNNKLPVFLPID